MIMQFLNTPDSFMRFGIKGNEILCHNVAYLDLRTALSICVPTDKICHNRLLLK